MKCFLFFLSLGFLACGVKTPPTPPAELCCGCVNKVKQANTESNSSVIDEKEIESKKN